MEKERRKKRAEEAKKRALQRFKRHAPEEPEEAEQVKQVRSELRDLIVYADTLERAGDVKTAILIRHMLTAEKIDQERIEELFFNEISKIPETTPMSLVMTMIYIVEAPRFPMRVATIKVLLAPNIVNTGEYIQYNGATTSVLHVFFGIDRDERYAEADAVAELLVEHAKFVHVRIARDITPLHLAIETEYVNGVRFILAKDQRMPLLKKSHYLTPLELVVTTIPSLEMAEQMLRMLLGFYQRNPLRSWNPLPSSLIPSILKYHLLRANAEMFEAVHVNFIYYLLGSKWVRQLLPIVLQSGLLLYREENDESREGEARGIVYSLDKISLVGELEYGDLSGESDDVIAQNLETPDKIDEYVLDIIVDPTSREAVKNMLSLPSLLHIRTLAEDAMEKNDVLAMNQLMRNGLLIDAFEPDLLQRAVEKRQKEMIQIALLPYIGRSSEAEDYIRHVAYSIRDEESFPILRLLFDNATNPTKEYFEYLEHIVPYGKLAQSSTIAHKVLDHAGLRLISYAQRVMLSQFRMDGNFVIRYQMYVGLGFIFPNSCLLGVLPMLCLASWDDTQYMGGRDVLYLLNEGADVNSTIGQECEHVLHGNLGDQRMEEKIRQMQYPFVRGTTALMLLFLPESFQEHVVESHLKFRDLMVERGADIYRSNDNGDSYASFALTLALSYPNKRALMTITTPRVQKVDLNIMNRNGHTPIYHLLEREISFHISTAIDYGARLDVGGDFFKLSERLQKRIIGAVMEVKSFSTLKFLIDSGNLLPLDDIDPCGFSALDAAALFAWPEGFQLLRAYELKHNVQIPIHGTSRYFPPKVRGVPDLTTLSFFLPKKDDNNPNAIPSIGDVVLALAVSYRSDPFIETLEEIAKHPNWHRFWGEHMIQEPGVTAKLFEYAIDGGLVYFERFEDVYARIYGSIPFRQELAGLFKFLENPDSRGWATRSLEKGKEVAKYLGTKYAWNLREFLRINGEDFMAEVKVLLWAGEITLSTPIRYKDGDSLHLASAIFTIQSYGQNLARANKQFKALQDDFKKHDFRDLNDAYEATGVTTLMVMMRHVDTLRMMMGHIAVMAPRILMNSHFEDVCVAVFEKSRFNDTDSKGRNAFDHFLETPLKESESTGGDSDLKFVVRIFAKYGFDFDMPRSDGKMYFELMPDRDSVSIMHLYGLASFDAKNADGKTARELLTEKFGDDFMTYFEGDDD